MCQCNSSTNELHHRLTSLETRHRDLEVRHRRVKRAGLWMMASLVMLGLGGLGYQRGQVIEARGVLLRDDDGRLRGSFVVGDDGGVRLTLVDQANRAKAGLWMDHEGRTSFWGFEEPFAPDSNHPSVRLNGQGKLITTDSNTRIIERRRDRWTCAYRLNLQNHMGRDIDQAFYVNLVDLDGYVLSRQPRMIRIAKGETLMLLGEISLPPERADQVQDVTLVLYENP